MKKGLEQKTDNDWSEKRKKQKSLFDTNPNK